jgi:hypothetical protein
MILGWSDQGELVARSIGTSEEGQSFIEHCGVLAMLCDSLTLSFIYILYLSSEFKKTRYTNLSLLLFYGLNLGSLPCFIFLRLVVL